ncbi:MAG: polysaccharide deacetylase family protein [Candidatus Thorarchaeota archaeon]
MVYIFIKVDFDRDAAFPMKGKKHAVSKSIQLKEIEKTNNPIKSAMLEGTQRSVEFFLPYLTDKKIPTTFYFEARSINIFLDRNPEYLKKLNQSYFEFGIHGYDHEDFLGLETGLTFSEKEEYNIISKAKKKVEALFSKNVVGFRAPYMRKSVNTNRILESLGFIYDSSVYQKTISAIFPYYETKNLIEFPVIKTPKDSKMKGMYTYLWPLFEGKRDPEDICSNYLELVKNSKDDFSYISINLHSWHFSYNISQERYLTDNEVKENFKSFTKLITILKNIKDVEFSTPELWLKEHKKILVKS